MATAALSFGNARFSIPQDRTSSSARELRTSVRRALQKGDRHLVVDCDGWNQVDFGMLSSLIQCASACREHGASFEVANMSSQMRADVHALQLSHRLGLHD